MRSLMLVLVLVLTGCENPFASDKASLSGSWYGETASGDLTAEFTMSQGRDGNVQGSGTLHYGTGNPAVQITGIHDPPHVSLTLFSGGSPVLTIEGQFQGRDSWSGSLCGFSAGCQNIAFERR